VINQDFGKIWLLGPQRYLYIESNVISSLMNYRQKNDQTEAGGCLLGFYRGSHIHINRCTTPMSGDLRQKYRFDRRDRYHVITAKEIHKQSGRKCTYLGDWHSHPEDIPTPSKFDYQEWDKITLIKREWPTVALVVGRTDFWVGVGCATNKIRYQLKKVF